VNVAARVEGLTKQYGLPILITEYTSVHASGLAQIEIDLVRVVGRAEPIAIFTLVGDETYAVSPEFAALFATHARMIATYRSGDFPAAANAVEAARKIAPPSLSTVYDVYAKRIAALLETPPPEPWDGVFMALEK
jgi:adenylate cyclase